MREGEIFIGAANYVKAVLLSLFLLVISSKVSGQGMA